MIIHESVRPFFLCILVLAPRIQTLSITTNNAVAGALNGQRKSESNRRHLPIIMDEGNEDDDVLQVVAARTAQRAMLASTPAKAAAKASRKLNARIAHDPDADEAEDRAALHLVAARRAEREVLNDYLARNGADLKSARSAIPESRHLPRKEDSINKFYSRSVAKAGQASGKQNQPMEAAAAAAAAALAHRAYGVGRRVATNVSNAATAVGRMLGPQSKPRDGESADAVTYARRVAAAAAHDPEDAGTHPDVQSADGPRWLDDEASVPVWHQRTSDDSPIPLEAVPVEDPFSDMQRAPYLGGRLNTDDKGEDALEAGNAKLWPASDTLPAPDADEINRTAYQTPSPLVWQADDPPPPLPVMLLPFVAFFLGLGCLAVLFIIDGGPFDRSRTEANRRAGAPSFHAKTDAIFREIDRDRDGFISFQEIRNLARITNPKGASTVTMDWFSDLCRPLGADPHRGLDRAEFRQTYILLGSDVDQDYAAVVERPREERIPRSIAGVSIDHSEVAGVCPETVPARPDSQSDAASSSSSSCAQPRHVIEQARPAA